MTMRRRDRQMSLEESRIFLQQSPYGILSMSLDDLPYAIPLHHYLEGDTLYFHAAPEGRKLDIIAQNPAVCYLVSEFNGFKTSDSDRMCSYGAYYRSVICHGTARIIASAEEKAAIVSKLTRHLAGDIAQNAPDVTPEQTKNICIIAVDIQETSGKACLPVL